MSDSFAVGARPRLELRIPAGRIRIDPGAPGAITVEVSGRGADGLEVGQTGDTVFVRRIQGGGWMRSGSVTVDAVVPGGCEIDVSVASADVDLRGEMGSTSVKTASGDVRAETVSSLSVSSASGDVDVQRVAGDADCSCASGDVSLGTVEGRLTVKLASGELGVGRAEGAVRGSSASGDLRIHRFEGDDVTLKSVSGDAIVAFPAGIRLEADCSSLSGAIRFPEGDVSPVEGSRRTVRMSARSVSGDIRVERC